MPLKGGGQKVDQHPNHGFAGSGCLKYIGNGWAVCQLRRLRRSGCSHAWQKSQKTRSKRRIFLGLKKRLEFENEELLESMKANAMEKDELAQSLSNSMTEAESLRVKIVDLEEDLSEAKDDLVRAQKVEPVEMPIVADTKEERKEEYKETILKWSKINSTLVFPLEVKITKDAISLQNRTGQVRIPVKVGQVVKALKYYPNSTEYMVVSQENSDKFLATVSLDNTNFLELLASIYEKRQKFMGRSSSNAPSLKSSTGLSPLPSLSPTEPATIENVKSTDQNTIKVVREFRKILNFPKTLWIQCLHQKKKRKK